MCKTTTVGILQCGICVKARELKCDIWIGNKKSKEDGWVKGTSDWSTYTAKKWESHGRSETHHKSIDFLYSRDHCNILTDIDKQSKGHLEKCQIQNRYFFAKGVMTNVLFLGKHCLPFFGNAFGKGLLAEFLQHVGKEYAPKIQHSLDSSKKKEFKGSNLLKPMHHRDVQFILKKFSHQIRKKLFDKLQACKSICIIADEWHDKASQEYCSVSTRYVMDNLSSGVIFLGFYRLKNILAETVKDAIKNAFSYFIGIDLSNKIVAQTYDGASNMQGQYAGVQKLIRDDFAPFAAKLHCINHQLQLSVKEMNKEPNIIKRVTENCYVIAKIIKYSPKMVAQLKDLKEELASIENGITRKKNEYASLKAKILDFCVTRWTVRAGSLKNIMKNYEALLTLFAKILGDSTERNRLNKDKRAEIGGLVKYLQTFEFFLGCG